MQNSRFWDELGAEHDRALQDHGPELIKRQQALRYFTWTWRWRALPKSEQFRFLLGHSTPWDLFSAATKSSDMGDTAWIGVPWTLADRWLYSFATRLLWRYADRATRGHPSLRLAEPLLGSPLPVVDCGRLISQDLANTAIELATIDRGGVRSPGQVLEVGAGYGRTAFAILSLFPDCKYTVVDIEPALTITRWYLTQLFPTDRITFLSPAQINEIPRSSMDLAVSIFSLSEMTPETRDEYLLLFDRVAAGVSCTSSSGSNGVTLSTVSLLSSTITRFPKGGYPCCVSALLCRLASSKHSGEYPDDPPTYGSVRFHRAENRPYDFNATGRGRRCQAGSSVGQHRRYPATHPRQN